MAMSSEPCVGAEKPLQTRSGQSCSGQYVAVASHLEFEYHVGYSMLFDGRE